MSSIKNVAIIGATGNLGPTILSALQASPNLTPTVVTRKDSTKPAPSGVNVISADYSSHESLTDAFKGQDAVVCTVGAMALKDQIKIIDAAIAAGVKHFIPSDFGSDTENEKTAALAVSVAKVQTRQYLKKKNAEGKINWTSIINGAFFDWGLKTGFLGFKPADKKATIYDGGSNPLSVTLLKDVGAAVAAVLSNPDSFKNRTVYVNSAKITQRQILTLYEKLTAAKWEVEDKDTAEIEKVTKEKIAKGDFSTAFHLLFRCLHAEGYGGGFEKVDNEALGIKLLSDDEIEQLIKSTL